MGLDEGQEQAFLGQGLQFPMGVNSRGGIAMTRGVPDIETAMRVILMTARGERRMRPAFGSSVYENVFAPNNATTHGLIAYHVQDALLRWEPRIIVQAVDVQPDIADDARVVINIQYQVKATNDDRNLVFPFYLIPQEEE